MSRAPTTVVLCGLDEPRRLAALRATDLLHADAEEAFDRLTRLAATILDAPVSLVSLVEPERQFFLSAVGLRDPWASKRETPISHSFCQHAVVSGEPLVIEDARQHPLVRKNPAISDIGVIAYAGVPLVNSDGYAIGSFCAIDDKPREWRDEEVQVLRDLAAATMTAIELRKAKQAAGARQRRVAAEIPSNGRAADQRGLNIAALARRTGVAPDTLRKWEHRYGILRPSRTGGGQRRYSEADVNRVEWLKARLAEGYRIGEAAALLGSAATVPTRDRSELRARVLEAARRNDPLELDRLLDHTFAVDGRLEDALVEIVQPLLEQVGEEWQRGEFNVAQEHLVSAGVRARLERLVADARGGTRGIAVLACAPGERHDLGLLMLAVMLRADGWQVAYLGADTPIADAVRFAETAAARLLCVSAATKERLAELERALTDVELPRDLELVVGGAAVTAVRARRLRAR